jgi:hypothetical protein
MPQVFSPYTVERMRRGRDILAKLALETSKEIKQVNLGGAKLSRLLLKNGSRYYSLGTDAYLARIVLKKLEAAVEERSSWDRVVSALKPDGDADMEWVDLSGFLCPRSKLCEIIERVKKGNIKVLKELQKEFLDLADMYDDMEWAYAVKIFKDEKGFDIENSSPEQLIEMLDLFLVSLHKFNNMVLSDAGREFEEFAKIGYGLYGEESEAERDFKTVRGTVKTNRVLQKLRKDISSFEKKVKTLKQKLKSF